MIGFVTAIVVDRVMPSAASLANYVSQLTILALYPVTRQRLALSPSLAGRRSPLRVLVGAFASLCLVAEAHRTLPEERVPSS